MHGLRDTIREFLWERYRLAPDNDEDLFESAYLDADTALPLVRWVEEAFGLTLNEADRDLANFRSVNAIQALIFRKVKE